MVLVPISTWFTDLKVLEILSALYHATDFRHKDRRFFEIWVQKRQKKDVQDTENYRIKFTLFSVLSEKMLFLRMKNESG